jgi:cyclic beta-1,2-glucan synthetase
VGIRRDDAYNGRTTILAFYGSGDEQAGQAYESIRSSALRSFHLKADSGDVSNALAKRFAGLRLSNEELIVAESGASAVSGIVKTLRTAGEPAVFLTRDGSPEKKSDGSADSIGGWSGILERLRDCERTLQTTRTNLIESARVDHAITESGKWILDNSHLLRSAIAEIRRSLPASFRKSLSRFTDSAGELRVLTLARNTLAAGHNVITEQNLVEVVNEYQKTTLLSIAELWVFPVMLRIALVEALASLAAQVSNEQQLRESAYLWANRLAEASHSEDPGSLAQMLGQLEAQPWALQPYFVTCLAEQLQDQEAAFVAARQWLEAQMGSSIADVVPAEHHIEAAESLAIANASNSLRSLSQVDFADFFEELNVVEREFRLDPAGTYPHNDFKTRDCCRRVVESIARRSGVAEVDVARKAIASAVSATKPEQREVCWHLLGGGVRSLEKELKARIPLRIRVIRLVRANATFFYLTGILFLTLCFAAVALSLAWDLGVRSTVILGLLGSLSLFPLSELALQILNALIIASFSPEPLPKLDFDKGVPPEHATLVVVPMLLSSAEVVRHELEKLEIRYLANQDVNIRFGLLSDFTDAAEQHLPGDSELFEIARKGIEVLNQHYPGEPFLLFHRERVWSATQGKWIGRERKRGKIEDLNRFLLGKGCPEILRAGKLSRPVRYVITLDSDTQLPPSCGRRLIATLAHPLNRPVIDPQTKVRVHGFAIIQPRVSIGLPDATASRFTSVFADTSGTDPYCQVVSDAQQDLFGEAIFHGKAIYDVAALDATTGDRFPAEALLSHDLIEGSYAGTALASDIELFENMPRDYAGFCKRAHRWIRGDWQIGAWTLRHVPTAGGGRERNPLRAINRWRIFDNLRRSLVPVASIMLLVCGWLISPVPGAWSLIVGLAIAIPAFAPAMEHLARRIQGKVIGWRGAYDELIRAVVMIAFLPHQAWLAVDAVFRVAYRTRRSKKHLLEWETAERAAADSHLHLSSTTRQIAIISACSVVLMFVLLLRHSFSPVSEFVLLWAASPALLIWLNKPSSNAKRRRLLRANQRSLRKYARQTWRFFDDLLTPATNWLPPDNSQLALRIEVANRTSPTNIGLWLCSALAARDFGYLTPDQLLYRCGKTMDTLGRLERYEGHLLNWYDTTTAQPLSPRYVSTVDSGNLLASLWVLAQGTNDVARSPLLGPICLRGLSDTLARLEHASKGDISLSMPIRAIRKLLRGKPQIVETIARLRMARLPAEQLRESCRQSSAGEERSYWSFKLCEELRAWNDTIDLYLKWMETLTRIPDFQLEELGQDVIRMRQRILRGTCSLENLSSNGPARLQQFLDVRKDRNWPTGTSPRIQSWFEDLEKEYQQAQRNAAQTTRSLHALGKRCLEFAESINMRFLYDTHRRLFGIGYLVGGPVEFKSHYDLLASECRLASFVAIAKGDVPIDHWFSLGRPRMAGRRGKTLLLSWTGTMFEYLMPLLFTRTFDNSLLDSACRNAVAEQINWGLERNLPWGVSESAWSALDSNQIYQYFAFGVPALGLKVPVDEGDVVAPYATMLALRVDPAAAIQNLERLNKLGLDGPMGPYESLDFTRQSTQEGKRGVIVYSYMSHHQGMSLLALGNLLHRDVMQRRFHSEKRIRAIESLLFERVPTTSFPKDDVRAGVSPMPVQTQDQPADRVWKENTLVPRVHLYGNGRYALMVSNAGGGYSRWNGLDLTRWRADSTSDTWGSFIFVKDIRSGATWSAAWQPMGGGMGTSSARFMADHAEFHRRTSDIETLLAVTVAYEDDAELRRLTITNWSSKTRDIEFTSYSELALVHNAADVAHPAFAKMFIETEYAGDELLIAHPRQRSPDDPSIWAGHMIVGATSGIQYETDRATFLGRRNTPATPDALGRELNSSVGSVVDPVFSLRCRLTLAPRDRVEIAFLTFAASSREGVLALAARYRREGAVAQAFEMQWTRAQLQFRYLGIESASAHRFQELASYLIYANPRLRPNDRIARNRLGQSALWALGISGDIPIITITIADPLNLNLVREVLLAHTYWRMRGMISDLVILNQESPSYDSPLRAQLLRLVEAHSQETGIDKPGGVFLRDWYPMPDDLRYLVFASSSVVLAGNRGSLAQQLADTSEAPAQGPGFVGGAKAEEPSQPLPFLELPYFNGKGGFSQDGREYAIYLKPGDTTPGPWVNVMANAGFGTLVSESGLGFTWRGNSQMNRLTPWNNDPVSDEPGEVIYLRDGDTGACWSPTPAPIREKDAYRARHGQGYSTFEHNSHAIGQELTVFVPVGENGSGDPLKICRLRLRNDSSRPRKLSVTYFAALVLGGVRGNSQLHVQTSRDEQTGALLAKQYWSSPYAGHVAFAASVPAATSYSGDRARFLGRNRTVAGPAAMGRERLDNRTGVGLDPCFALQVEVFIDKGGQAEVVFLLGQAETSDACRAILARCGTAQQIEHALNATRRWWDTTLGVLQVRTPLLSADLMLNRWLLYQSLSCRFWGRSAFYQSSGAIGFRDQLQDSLAFVYAAPHLTRAHILLAAARQFVEGDVQHWWHPETGMGVRTKCSDDLVWLPFAVAHYVEATGDRTILEETVPFLEAPPLGSSESERMSTPSVAQSSATLWEHCCRALDHAWRLGPHRLPLIGNGDWNDGMNRVGIEGKGESVWMVWFLGSVLKSFGDMTEQHAGVLEGATARVKTWRDRAAELASAAESSAWDGSWYLRAFFDNGSPLGSRANTEARIDSLPQSWSVISGLADRAKSIQAMESAQSQLVDEVNHLVRLFTPPFDHSEPHPGYIMGYPPGLRENGGQYTHGSLWMAMAWVRLGRGDLAARLLTMMNPVERTRTPEDVDRYRGEPYAVAADVSTAAGRIGRSGWTWYTGSAAWMYRIWIEEVLGFKLKASTLSVHPTIPADWPGFELTYRYGRSKYDVLVQREPDTSSIKLQLDRVPLEGETISLVDDGRVHSILVVIPDEPVRQQDANRGFPAAEVDGRQHRPTHAPQQAFARPQV